MSLFGYHFISISNANLGSGVPEELKNPDTWFDPTHSSSLVLSGGKVVSWADRTGGSLVNTITQNVDANRPIFSAGGLNGNDALFFPANSSFAYHLAGSFLSTVSPPFTIITVATHHSDSHPNGLWQIEATGSVDHRFFIINQPAASFAPDTTGNLTFRYRNEGGSWLGNVGAQIGPGPGVGPEMPVGVIPSVVGMITNGAGALTGFRNEISAAGGHGAVDPTDELTIGAWKNGSSYVTTQSLNGFCGDFLVYNRELSSSDLISVKNYLYTKWGITP